jgi:DNA repair exonuclease SbcCD ATPase subunit
MELLTETVDKLNLLEEEERDLPNDMARAILETDELNITSLGKRQAELQLELFGARARLLQQKIKSKQKERAALEKELKLQEFLISDSAHIWRTIMQAQRDAHAEHAELQVRTYSMEMRSENLREEIDDLNKSLQQHVENRMGGR